MSGYNRDENALENNIQSRQFELLSLVDEDKISIAGNYKPKAVQCGSCRGNCVCQRNNVFPQNHMMHFNANQKGFNIGNHTMATPMTPTYPIQTGYNFKLDSIYSQGVNIHASGNNEREANCRANATKMVTPNVKKFKNKKKFFYLKCSAHANIDYTNIIVNLNEIGLGIPRTNLMDSHRLKLKFKQLYVYLTSLCKERIRLESIIGNQQNFEGKYVLPSTVSVAGHFEYSLKTLSVEMKFVETIVHKIQHKCDDSMFTKMYRQQANNLVAAVNMLAFLKGSDIFCDVNNADAIRRVDDVLASVINNVRYMAVIYTIYVYKLLLKEANALQSRRKMFIGR